MASQDDGRSQPPGQLRAEAGPSAEVLSELRNLATACVEHDGGRLKLEWRTLESRPTDQVNDFLWYGPDGLVGFLGIYGFRPDQAEICGMVHPSHRRRGIFSHLFEAARDELRRRSVPLTLLVVDRLYEAGAGFALSVGGEIEHSEHRMVLRREPAAFRADPLVKVRPALRDDARFIVACLAEAFDFPADHLDDDELASLAERYSNTLVIERDGERVGTVRVERQDGGADVYGFAVLPLFQGRGIGRQVLSSIASELVAEGVPRVSLEVSTNNDGALGLYLSCGFEVTGTEDYWAVPIGAG